MNKQRNSPQTIAKAYGWRQIGAIMCLFFAPIILLLLGIILWSFVDRGAVKHLINTNLVSIFAAATQLAGIVLALTYIARRSSTYRLSWATFGLRKAPIGRSIKYILGFFGLAFLTVIVVGLTVQVIVGDLGSEPITTHATKTGIDWVFLLVGGVIIAPISEEIIFRGVTFGFLRERYPIIWAALGSSLFFMLAHVDPLVFITALPLGLYLCFMYRRLGSIYPGIALHMLWNLMIALVK